MYDLYPGITIQQLRVFLVAANTQSFSKTAVEVNMTVSSVSRVIASLETALGTALFERSKQRITLSKAGEKFCKDIKPIMKHFEIAVNNARENASKEQEEIIRIADLMMIDMAVYLLPVVKDFEARYPNIRCMLEPVDHDNLFNGRITGKYDLAMVSDSLELFAKRAGLTFKHLIDGDPCLIITDNHPLFGKEDLSVEDLRNERIVALDSGYSDYKKMTFGIYERFGFSMKDVTIVPTAASAEFELKKGNCVALFNSAYASKRSDVRAVKIYPKSGDGREFGFGIIYDSSRLSQSKKRLIASIEKYFETAQ